MKSNSKRPPTSSATLRTVTVVLILIALVFLFLLPIGFNEIKESRLTYEDYQYGEYTYSHFTMVRDSNDETAYNYYIHVKELDEPLFIDNIVESDELTHAIHNIPEGAKLSLYTDGAGHIVELVDGKTVVLSLDEYSEARYDNGLALIIVFSVICALLFIIATVSAALYPKAKRREREIAERYRIRTVPTPKRMPRQPDDIVSRATFVTFTVAVCLLPVLFLVFLILGIVQYEADKDGSSYIIIAVASIVAEIVLVITQYRRMTRYESFAFVKKLYETNITRASLPLDRDTLTQALLRQDYNRTDNTIFSKTKKVYQNKNNQTHHYHAHFVSEEAIAALARSLETPLPKGKANIFTHDLYFVFVEDSLTEAIESTYRVIEHSISYSTRSLVPILLYEGNLYFVTIGSTMRPYRIALNEALFMLGLL